MGLLAKFDMYILAHPFEESFMKRFPEEYV